jgi:hypothetical protein
MRIRLQISKQGASLFEGTYEVSDPESFGQACADAWQKLRDQHLEQATSVGQLMDMLNETVLDTLQGAEITVARA